MALTLRITLLILLCANAYGQGILSPKFQNQNARITNDPHLRFSISVKDDYTFLIKYQKKLQIKSRHGNTFHVNARYDLIVNEVAADKNILFIDMVTQPVTEAGIDFANPAFNRITKTHAAYQTLIGEDQNVSIKENKFDTDNIDLLNRSFTTSLTPDQISQHSTTMATLIAGGGNSSLKGLGVAPAAHLTSSDFNNLLPDPEQIFLTNNIYLQNHSYGVLIENYYGNEAEAYDDQMLNNPKLLHVFSAGNIGQQKPDAGTYVGLPYANLSGNFKHAKNVIVTTAVDTSFLVNTLNSKGPAYDGRLKPELAAYGQGGTSDAAALVSGVCTLIQEKYRLINGHLPLSSTIKAILITAADDIGNKGIDFTYGYGNVNAYKAIQLIEQDKVLELAAISHDALNIPITVDDEIAELKVAVAWIDPPALQNSSVALVHDIDCMLTDGTTDYLPWVLNSFPKTDSLTAKAKRKQDHLNNVEYFTIENPIQGTYTLSVTVPELTTENQNISIAYWFEKKEFLWDYPMASDVLEAGKKETLFWHYPYNDTGDLYMQMNNGNWQLIKENVDLSHHQHWTVPDTLSSAKLKMIIDGNEFLSDEFTISPQLKIDVAFNCDTEFSLSWNSIANADSYEVSTMGEKYLEKKLSTPDTSIIIPKNDNKVYYSIAPKFSASTGLKSQTINYEEQGAYCYINLFSAQRFEHDIVTLQLLLSTTINVAQIKIYKSKQGIESILASVLVTNMTTYTFFDENLTAGTIQYQAEVILKNGTKIRSALNETIIETANKAILFPNPITNNDEMLSVLSEGEGITLEVTNNMGQQIMLVDLELTIERIEIKHLPAGLYLYVLKRNKKAIDSGRFIKY